MKNRILMAVAFTLSLPTLAFAQPQKKSRYSSLSTTDRVTVSSSALSPEPRAHAAPTRWGFGLQTFSNFAGNNTAVSGWIELGTASVIQPVITIGGTSPFQFGVGSFYRHQVAGTRRLGFHVGGGFGLGVEAVSANSNGFFFTFAGLAGFHFSFPELPSVLASIDAAGIFKHFNDNSNFVLGGLSPALGLNVHYLF